MRQIIRVVLGTVQGEAHNACVQRQVLGSKHRLRLATAVSAAHRSLAPSYAAVRASSAPAPAAKTDLCLQTCYNCILCSCPTVHSTVVECWSLTGELSLSCA